MTTQEYLQWPLLATWRVPDEHPVLPGHFPAYPVLPGALLLDWVIGLVSSYPRRLAGVASPWWWSPTTLPCWTR